MVSSSDDELDLLTPSKRRKLAAAAAAASPRSPGKPPRSRGSEVTSPGTVISRRSGRAIRKPKAFEDESSDDADADDVSGFEEEEEDEEEEEEGVGRGRARTGTKSNGRSRPTPSDDDEDEGEGDEDDDSGRRRRPKRKIVAPAMRSPVLLSKAAAARSSRSRSQASPTPAGNASKAKQARLPRKRNSSPCLEAEVVITAPASLKGKAKALAPSSAGRKRKAVKDEENGTESPSKAMPGALSNRGDSGEASFIKPTSADAYFSMHAPKTAAARRAKDQTSSNLISSSWPSLSSTAISKFSKALAEGSIAGQGSDSALRPSSFRPLWDKWLALASSNHSILFHGVGSMRGPLEAFLLSVAQRGIAGAVVLKGEMGGKLEEAMAACERYAGIQSPLEAGAGRKAGGGSLARAQRIAEAFGATKPDIAQVAAATKSKTSSSSPPSKPRLFLLVDDIAAPHLLSVRSQTLLGILSKAPNLHLLGTVSHVSADSLAGMAGSASPRWVWQDLTTFQTPLDEMLVTRHGGGGLARLAGLPKPLSLSSGVVTTSSSSLAAAAMEDGRDEAAVSNGAAVGKGGGAVVDEANGGPAGPVLKSVTFRSRRVFLLVAQYQLEMLSERHNGGGGGGSSSTKTPQERPESLAMPYAKLKEQAARTAFINDMDMRSLLGEHLEHGFIRVALPSTSSSGENETWQGGAGGGAGEASQGGQGQSQSQAVPGNQSHSYRAIPEHAALYLALSPDEIRSAVALCKRLPQH